MWVEQEKYCKTYTFKFVLLWKLFKLKAVSKKFLKYHLCSLEIESRWYFEKVNLNFINGYFRVKKNYRSRRKMLEQFKQVWFLRNDSCKRFLKLIFESNDLLHYFQFNITNHYKRVTVDVRLSLKNVSWKFNNFPVNIKYRKKNKLKRSLYIICGEFSINILSNVSYERKTHF